MISELNKLIEEEHLIILWLNPSNFDILLLSVEYGKPFALLCNPKLCTRTWRSGYFYLNKGDCNLNQWKHDSFVERVAKNNSLNNGEGHKIHEIFLINCFVFLITLVCRTVHSSAMTQIKAHLMEKTLQLTVRG